MFAIFGLSTQAQTEKSWAQAETSEILVLHMMCNCSLQGEP